LAALQFSSILSGFDTGEHMTPEEFMTSKEAVEFKLVEKTTD
jgi:hypothetical protein